MNTDGEDARLLFVVNDPAFFLSHRLPLARAARDADYDVVVATGPGEGVATIRQEGMTHMPLPLTRSGTNPLEELGLLLAIARLYRRVQPDIVHLVTIPSSPCFTGGLWPAFCESPAWSPPSAGWAISLPENAGG